MRVRADSVAEEAGLKEGDLILEVNRMPVPSLTVYERVVSKLSTNQPVLLLIKRQGRTSFITLKQ